MLYQFEYLGFESIVVMFCRVKHVYGYEVVPQAISDACINAKLNGICNATFIQGDLNKIGENFGNEFPKPDVVITGYLLLRIGYLGHLFFNVG